jgi:hypothetical protein
MLPPLASHDQVNLRARYLVHSSQAIVCHSSLRVPYADCLDGGFIQTGSVMSLATFLPVSATVNWAAGMAPHLSAYDPMYRADADVVRRCDLLSGHTALVPLADLLGRLQRQDAAKRAGMERIIGIVSGHANGEMGWGSASQVSVPAQVTSNPAVWNRAVRPFPNEPMGVEPPFLPVHADMEDGVTVVVACPVPPGAATPDGVAVVRGEGFVGCSRPSVATKRHPAGHGTTLRWGIGTDSERLAADSADTPDVRTIEGHRITPGVSPRPVARCGGALLPSIIPPTRRAG